MCFTIIFYLCARLGRDTMIFYFTGTGNSHLVALRIANETGDRLVQLPTSERHFRLAKGENLGFVHPVYFLGLPTIVRDFLSEVYFDLGGDNYVFDVCTFGTTSGMATFQATRLLSEHTCIGAVARFSVSMVDVWTPMFDLSDQKKNRLITERALPRIDSIAQKVASRTSGVFDHYRLPTWFARQYYKIYERKRQTKNFWTRSDCCVQCGLCERSCPVGAIRLGQTSGPKWVKEECALCLRCLHHCPTFAIQYGSKTERHGQFNLEKVKL